MLRFTGYHVITIIIFFAMGTSVSAQLAPDSAKFVGNILSYDVPDNFDNYWNQVTPENAGKWGSVAGSQDTSQWNWGNLDMAYNYAKENGLPFKNHALMWGQQQPEWIDDLDSAAQAEIVETWIQMTAERYPETDLIDVVNEPLHAPPSYKEAIGGDGETGWDWAIWGFEKAREYYPDAKLLINDYNILRSNQSTLSYKSLISLLQERNLIDGIGLQAHFLEETRASTISGNLNSLAKTGLPIYISEYDVNIADNDRQLEKMQEQFPIFWQSDAVEGITFWGYIESRIWREDAYLIDWSGRSRPALDWLETYIDTAKTKTSVTSPGPPISEFQLEQNFPNPFNPETQIKFTLSINEVVTMEVYDISGRKVETLLSGRHMSAGTHTVRFTGAELPGGMYLYKLQTPDNTEHKKMVLLK
ncbi:MAG: endo-1,4-beta-xylanase [Candidatus Marinimicrobia bacterium]|nr:endo-1,4-beta-xylanase [Candidatus Neomarinimicrobiota bacterium]MCF7880618.1 endo-1,4-beta-xylanase [Candidatus Neomarinimicrobiota bacterium]